MRSTEDKLIHIPLNSGMNQAPSTRLAPTGTLSSVQNCRISGNGILEKRPGSLALIGTTARSPAHSLQGDGATINIESPAFACQVQSALMVGNTYGDAFAYSTVWQFQGRFSTCLPVRKRYGLAVDDVLVSGDGFGQTPPDTAVTTSGYLAVAAITNSGKLHFYIEDSNGVRLYYGQVNGPVARVRLTVQSDVVNLITQSNVTIAVAQITIAAGVASLTASTSIATLSSSSANWDAASYDSTGWFLAYQDGAASMTLTRFNAAAQVATTSFSVVTLPPVTLWADPVGQKLWVGFYDDPSITGNVKFSVWTVAVAAAITIVKAATTLKTGLLLGPPMFGRHRGVGAHDSTKAFYCFAQTQLTGSLFAATWVGAAFSSATAPLTPVACWHVIPISKPDNFNRVWCMTQSFSGNQLLSRVLLLRFADEFFSGGVVSPPTVELSSPNFPALNPTFNPLGAQPTWFSGNGGLGSTRSYFALPVCLQQFYTAQAIIKMDVYEYTTAEQEPHRQTTRFGVSTIVAGQPVEFWGQSVSTINNSLTSGSDAGAFEAGASEIGFPHAPIVSKIVASNFGTDLTAGTRSYRFTFEWVDLYGRRHQSPPSNPVSLTTAGPATESSATITVSSLDTSQRQAANTGLRSFLRLFRTVAGGTEYHECAHTAQAYSAADGTITFIDSESDANISQSGFLYTDGGVLDDTLAPSCRFTCKSEDRIWFGGLWDANIIQCSKVIVPGEPIQCTDDASFQVQLPGPCTGLAYMDGNVVAFTADAIYLVGGDGPNDQGAGSFSAPRCLTRSVGCADYRSIVETNSGVMFQSNLGLYMLPRGFGPAQYVGAAVRDDMASLSDPTQDLGPVVLGAISHVTRDNHLARFLVAAGSSPPPTSATDVFTYDLDDGQWFRDTFTAVLSEIGAYDSLASTGNKGAAFVYASLSTAIASPVLLEATAAASDSSGTLDIPQFVETAWVHPFGLGGYGKVNCVMVAVEALGASQTLTLTVQLDDNTSQVTSWVITAQGTVSYRCFYLAPPHACTAIQIQLQGVSASPGAIGGFKFISCTLEVEPTGGIRLLSDSEKN